MDYTKLSLNQCLNLACKLFGLENKHTIVIARLKEVSEAGYLTIQEATIMAQIIYNHGTIESLCYNNEGDETGDC